VCVCVCEFVSVCADNKSFEHTQARSRLQTHSHESLMLCRCLLLCVCMLTGCVCVNGGVYVQPIEFQSKFHLPYNHEITKEFQSDP